jgi:hypothetical protein
VLSQEMLLSLGLLASAVASLSALKPLFQLLSWWKRRDNSTAERSSLFLKLLTDKEALTSDFYLEQLVSLKYKKFIPAKNIRWALSQPFPSEVLNNLINGSSFFDLFSAINDDKPQLKKFFEKYDSLADLEQTHRIRYFISGFFAIALLLASVHFSYSYTIAAACLAIFSFLSFCSAWQSASISIDAYFANQLKAYLVELKEADKASISSPDASSNELAQRNIGEKFDALLTKVASRNTPPVSGDELH